MPNNESTTKFKADISQLKSAMQQAQREVKLANAQFKAASASMDDWSHSADGLKAKLTQLTTVQGAQRKQLSLLENELELTKKEYGENSAQADNLRIRIENQKAALAKTEKEIGQYTKELDNAGKETDQLGDESQQTEKQVKGLSDGFTTAKAVLANLAASGIKAAISGLKNLASAAKEAYQEFDKGADAVIKATGATGEAAKELEESYNNVAHNVVGDMGDIGSALGEINTRFGFTGTELENATEQFMKFADITGTDATEAVRLVSRAMENSGMDTKEYSNLLDILAKAGQATGVSVSTLTEQITKTGPTMRTLGFTTEETIAMIAKFEKEGLNTETVLAGMKKAVAFFGKEGVNAEAGFRRVLNAIKEAPDIAAASEIAIEAFGSKAGPELVEDVRAGKLEYQDFLKVLKNSTGTVTDTYEATQDGFDKVKLAIQGGRADIGKFVRELATEHQGDILKVIDKVKEGIKKAIKWFVDNADVIFETLKAIGKIIAVVFAVKQLSKFAGAINGVISVVKGLSAAIKGAEAATTAMNATSGILSKLISPGGAVVLGITAVVAVVASLISIFGDADKEIQVFTKDQEEAIQKGHEMAEAYKEMDEARQNSFAAVDAEYKHYQELADELDTLVDENGRVTKGPEERAQFILTTLNEALGTEIQMTDGVIKNYKEEKAAIDDLMKTKRAQAVLSAGEAAYTEALQKQTEAAQAYAHAQNVLNETRAEFASVSEQYNKVFKDWGKLSNSEAQKLVEDNQELYDSYWALHDAVGVANDGFRDAERAYVGYNQTIKNYEGLSAAIISGDVDSIAESMDKMEYSFIDANTGTERTLKDQVRMFEQNATELKKALESKTPGITKEMVDRATQMKDKAVEQFELFKKKAEVEAEGGYASYVHYAEIYGDKAKEASAGLRKKADEGLKSDGAESTSGKNFGQGYADGIKSKNSVVYNSAFNLALTAIGALKKGQKEGSPSKITTKSGEYFTQGLINGIKSKAKDLYRTVSDMTKTALGELDGSQMVKNARSSAANLLGNGGALSFNTSGAKAGVVRPGLTAAASGGQYGNSNSSVTNNYNLVQNNTSPKALTALETYQARRQQVAMVKAMM